MHVTACQCAGPGWCERHRCYKTYVLFQLCRRSEGRFRLWELGRGPRQLAPPLRGAPNQDCLLRGEVLGEEPCPSCRGLVRIKIFSCPIHQECTLGKALAGIACCATCSDAVHPQPNPETPPYHPSQ